MRAHRSRASGAPAVPPSPRRPHAKGLLRLIWSEQTISRAEIARRTELSRSTVSETVSELLATGLVVEAGPGQSSGGRRPIVLQFQDDAFGLVGVAFLVTLAVGWAARRIVRRVMQAWIARGTNACEMLQPA